MLEREDRALENVGGVGSPPWIVWAWLRGQERSGGGGQEERPPSEVGPALQDIPGSECMYILEVFIPYLPSPPHVG